MTISPRTLFVILGITFAFVAWAAPVMERQTDDRFKKALLASFDRFAGDTRLKLVQLAGEAAIGDQVEPADSEFLRARKAPPTAR